MPADTLTKTQKNRREKYWGSARKTLIAYSEKSLSKALGKEIGQSQYEEWRLDYRSLILMGRRLKDLNTDEFRVFAMAVYGWMPVMYSQQNIRKLKSNIEKLITGPTINSDAVEQSASCFVSGKHTSGSISAVSKLLHFCSPSKYPIWDTRVAKAVGRESGTGNDANVYLDYLAVMSNLKNDSSLSAYYVKYKKVVDGSATKIRALEHGLFLKS